MLLRCHTGSWYSLSLHLAFLCFPGLIVFNICGNTESLRFFWCGCFALVLHCIWIVLPLLILWSSQISLFEYFLSLSLMKLWLVINICNSIPFHVFHLFVCLPHAGQWLKNFPSDQLVFLLTCLYCAINLPIWVSNFDFYLFHFYKFYSTTSPFFSLLVLPYVSKPFYILKHTYFVYMRMIIFISVKDDLILLIYLLLCVLCSILSR